MYQEFIGFLKQNYFLVVYGITWFFSVSYYKKYFDTVLKYFPILIAFTFLSELLGYLVVSSDKFALFSKFSSHNALVYNIYSIIFFPYFYFIYWKLIENSYFKNWIKYLALTTILSVLINSSFTNPLIEPLYFTIVYASIILVICITFHALDKKNKWSWNFEKYNLMRWVSTGLIVFYSIFPIIFLMNFFNKYLWIKYNLGNFQKILIVIMYVLFCIGFSISRRRSFR